MKKTVRWLLTLLLLLVLYSWVKALDSRRLAGIPQVAPTLTPITAQNSANPPAGKIILAGTILPLEAGSADSGTHRLLDDKGETLAWLVSRKIDLNFTVPGVIVEVSGKVAQILGGGKPLLQVESLKYRKIDKEQR